MRVERQRFLTHVVVAGARDDGEHPAVTAHTDDAAAVKAVRRCRAVEDDLDATEPRAQVVERAADHDGAAIDDGDAIGNLLDVGELMRREKHGHPLAADVRHERLQDLFGDGGIEPGRRLVEDQELGAA